MVEEYLKQLQVEASLYGLLLNLTKTQPLKHPKLENSVLQFADGDPVPAAESVKYLGSPMSADMIDKVTMNKYGLQGHHCRMPM